MGVGWNEKPPFLSLEKKAYPWAIWERILS